MPGPSSEPEKYTIDEMMDRLTTTSSESPEDGELVTRADGSQMIRVKRRKRRSHQPHKQEESSKRSRITLIIVSVALLLLLGIGGLGLIVYTNSAPFRNQLAQSIRSATGSEVKFTQLRINPAAANISQVGLDWPEDSPVRKAVLTSVKADLSPLTFLGKSLRGNEVIIGNTEIHLDSSTSPQPADRKSAALPLSFDRYDFQKLSAHFGKIASITDSTATLSSETHSGNVEIRFGGGQLKAADWPALRLERATLENNQGEWNIVSAFCEHPSDPVGSLLLSGTIRSWKTQQESVINVKAESFLLSGFIGDSFGRLISGRIDTSPSTTSNFLTVQPNAATPYKLDLEWQSSLNSSFEVTGFPFLSTLSQAVNDRAYLTPRFLTQTTGTLKRDGERIILRNFHAISKSHIALKGELTVHLPTQTISGKLYLGLPDPLVRLTRSFEPYFEPIVDGFRWREINISGSLASPTDDFEAKLREGIETISPVEAPKTSIFEQLTTPSQ